MKNIQALIFTLFLALLLACGGNSSQVQETEEMPSKSNTKPEQEAKMEGFRKIEINGLYALQVPDFLIPYPDLNDAASLQYAYEGDNLFLIIIDEAKTDIEEGRSLEDYYEYANNNLTTGLHSILLEEFSTLNVNGLNGIFWSIEGSMQPEEGDAITVIYQVKVIESPTHFYQIIYWTTWENREKYKKELDMMIGSFKEI